VIYQNPYLAIWVGLFIPGGSGTLSPGTQGDGVSMDRSREESRQIEASVTLYRLLLLAYSASFRGESLAINQLPVNRREFLNLTWLASLGFLAVDLGAVTVLNSLPQLGDGEFGGQFELGRAGDVLPLPGANPLNFPKGKFWLSRTHDNRLVAPYKVCPHLGCLYNWNEEGNPLLLPSEDLQLIIETGQLITGKPKGIAYSTDQNS
jgi:hypothetical protein